MSGSITFNLPSDAIARFDLDAIVNVHTDGSGLLKFNVIGTASEFDFTCADEAAAQRIVQLIFNLKQQGFATNYEVTDAINYPLPAIPVTAYSLLYYDYLNNNWYVYADGTNMASVGYVIFAGQKAMIAAGTATSIQSETINKPAYGVLDLDYYDARDNFLATATINFTYTLSTFLPNPFVAMVDNVSVDGTDFNNALLGTLYAEDRVHGSTFFDGYHCPATFVDVFTLSFPATDWLAGDAVVVPPLFLHYRDSSGNLSNAVYVASVT